jgi:hypothetical protein
MVNLSVPVPELVHDEVIPNLVPGLAVLEKPLTVRCAQVSLPDGTPFGLQHLGAAGFFIYRRRIAGAPVEIWDETAKQWQPDAGGIPPGNLKPKPFFFKEGDPFPWQGVLVGAMPDGGIDKVSGNLPPQFLFFPQYFFRVYFANPRLFSSDEALQTDLDNRLVSDELHEDFKGNGQALSRFNTTVAVQTQGNEWHVFDPDNQKAYAIKKADGRLDVYALGVNGDPLVGFSNPSQPVRFVSAMDAARAGIRLKEGEQPQNATEIHLFLRDQNHQLIGTVEIRNDGQKAQIELAKWDGGSTPVSRVLLETDGSISIVAHETVPAQRASIRLDASGDIAVQPAQGRTTALNNALEISASGGDVTLHCAGNLTLDSSQEITLNAPKVTIATAQELETERILYRRANLLPTDPKVFLN